MTSMNLKLKARRAASYISVLPYVALFHVTAQAATVPMATQEPDSFEDQVAEYIERYPAQESFNYIMRYTGGDSERLNARLYYQPSLTAAGDDIVVRMNNDTYYSAAVLSLDNGPVYLSSNNPASDRFYSFQLMDHQNINYRNIIRPAGEYTMYFGEKPEDIRGEAIEVPSSLSIVIVRVEVKDKNDPEDVAAAKSVYQGFAVSVENSTAHPKIDLLSQFSPEVADEAHRRMDKVFTENSFLSDLVLKHGQELGKDISYLEHAASAKGAWGGPVPSHSDYEMVFTDKNGDTLMGSAGTYTVTTEQPPVSGFWSVTVYDTERGGFLHPNESNHYHFNGTTAVPNDDGTMTFSFQQSCTASNLNCLEVPAGSFDLTIRYYLPDEQIISREWTFPKLELQAE